MLFISSRRNCVSSPQHVRSFLLLQNLRQHFAVGAKVYFFVHPHYGATNKAWFLKHEFDQIIVLELCLIKTHRLESGRTEAEHNRGGLPLQQSFDFHTGKGCFEKIPLVDFRLLLQEKLSRFPAGGSSVPAEKINFHHRSSLSGGSMANTLAGAPVAPLIDMGIT